MTNNPLPIILAAALLPAAPSAADPPPDPDPRILPESPSAFRLEWTSDDNWTYFVQWSDDLLAWHTFPFAQPGTDHSPFHFSTDSPRLFLRVACADNLDPDGDGLTTSEEFANFTDPLDADTDHDGLSDPYELQTLHTLPFLADTDGDGLDDGDEITDGTNPLMFDTDSDGIPDGQDGQPLDPASAPPPAATTLLLWTTLEPSI